MSGFPAGDKRLEYPGIGFQSSPARLVIPLFFRLQVFPPLFCQSAGKKAFFASSAPISLSLFCPSPHICVCTGQKQSNNIAIPGAADSTDTLVSDVASKKKSEQKLHVRMHVCVACVRACARACEQKINRKTGSSAVMVEICSVPPFPRRKVNHCCCNVCYFATPSCIY